MATGKKRLLLIAAVIFCVLLPLLLVCGYFFATSSYFLSRVALPYAGKSAGIKLAAKSVDFRPFSGKIAITGLTAGEPAAPILHSENITLQCDLFSLPGKIQVAGLAVSNVTLKLEADKDGRWNLPMLNPAPAASGTKKGTPSTVKPSAKTTFKLPYIDVRNVSLQNINLTVNSAQAGNELAASVKGFNLKTDNVAPGREAVMELAGQLSFRQKGIDVRNCDLKTTAKLQFNQEFLPQGGKLELLASGMKGGIGDLDLDDNPLSLTGSWSQRARRST